MKSLLITLWCMVRKHFGFCTHPVHAELSVMIKGIEIRRCRKCQECIQQHSKYWVQSERLWTKPKH
jgi:hypothetical protein